MSAQLLHNEVAEVGRPALCCSAFFVTWHNVIQGHRDASERLIRVVFGCLQKLRSAGCTSLFRWLWPGSSDLVFLDVHFALLVLNLFAPPQSADTVVASSRAM
ncbi:unnamed protein product [Polarella glacialis]|uniref:Uncharacterized protein n=1 Tax=Polarella glacialis TaxID=89957 RepID=A0A813IMG8_POLGL|nr:unnamed protein product [Polarella glacialis]